MTRHADRLALLAVVFYAWSVLWALSAPTVQFRNLQHVYAEGEEVRVVLWIERGEDHDRLTVTAWDGDFPVRRSSYPLGARHSRLQTIRWWSLPPAAYRLVAVVTDVAGAVVGEASDQIVVADTRDF